MKAKTKPQPPNTLAELKRLKARLSSSKQPPISEAEAIRRLRVTEAKRAELKLRRETGELLERSEVTRAWGSLISTARNRFLGMGDKLADHLAVEGDAPLCKAMVDAEVREILTDLSRSELPPELDR
jgi:hypothetical protein